MYGTYGEYGEYGTYGTYGTYGEYGTYNGGPPMVKWWVGCGEKGTINDDDLRTGI